MSAETIFFIAILLFYLIVQASARKKQTGQKQSPRPQRAQLPHETRPAGPAGTEWEDALREIHEKLASTKATQPLNQPAGTAPQTSFAGPGHSFESGGGVEQQKRATVWFDTAISAPPPAPAPRPVETGKTKKSEPATADEIRELLRKPGTLRNTIILSEVLSPPRSGRPR